MPNTATFTRTDSEHLRASSASQQAALISRQSNEVIAHLTTTANQVNEAITLVRTVAHQARLLAKVADLQTTRVGSIDTELSQAASDMITLAESTRGVRSVADQDIAPLQDMALAILNALQLSANEFTNISSMSDLLKAQQPSRSA